MKIYLIISRWIFFRQEDSIFWTWYLLIFRVEVPLVFKLFDYCNNWLLLSSRCLIPLINIIQLLETHLNVITFADEISILQECPDLTLLTTPLIVSMCNCKHLVFREITLLQDPLIKLFPQVLRTYLQETEFLGDWEVGDSGV